MKYLIQKKIKSKIRLAINTIFSSYNYELSIIILIQEIWFTLSVWYVPHYQRIFIKTGSCMHVILWYIIITSILTAWGIIHKKRNMVLVMTWLKLLIWIYISTLYINNTHILRMFPIILLSAMNIWQFLKIKLNETLWT